MNSLFNRLWVRLSFAFFIAVFIGTFLPTLLIDGMVRTGILEQRLVSAETSLPPDLFDEETYVFESEAEMQAWLAENDILAAEQSFTYAAPVFEIIVPERTVVSISAVLSVMLGGLIGIVISRSISKPLSDLATATRAIGDKNLSYRAAVQGSNEMQELAMAFNSMADSLETGEAVRQNMMADVAHELRTPLSVLDGNLRAMIDGIFPMTTDEIGLLHEQTAHLTRLVNDLRELSLAEAGQLPLHKDTIDLASMIDDTVTAFGVIADEQGVQLSAETTHPINMLGDLNRLRQVMHNLLANAIQHTPAGGTIRVSAKQADSQIEIVIRDSGLGISAEKLAIIFDRFQRGSAKKRRDSGGSSGLGLAIVNAIINLHDGSISASSLGKNKGSTFTIVLPTSS